MRQNFFIILASIIFLGMGCSSSEVAPPSDSSSRTQAGENPNTGSPDSSADNPVFGSIDSDENQERNQGSEDARDVTDGESGNGYNGESYQNDESSPDYSSVPQYPSTETDEGTEEDYADPIVDAPEVPLTALSIPELTPVYFAYDTSQIPPFHQESLRKYAQWLKGAEDIRIQLEGHADERGSNAYNLALGERRARAVYDFLIEEGISEQRLSIISFGEERPAQYGQTETAWRYNRRVEFTRF